MAIKSTIQEFARTTTIHGIAYVFDNALKTFDRILWVAIIVRGFSLASFIIHDSVMDWEEN